ncbi:MAG: ribonuclease P [Nanoarchaeota archaeon]|nr:ribonuclease P [Nanoarchaeota archaeon]MBU4242531.1 ribonuclease P [Nanoarchaeota archaeon]MBU4351550.1 ribonuclease P [Nanoarchaeota archaeon]MBU4456985.1 ribonuclease P [Nanoarchaeota archaeon]
MKKKNQQEKIAKERIECLFELADKHFKTNPSLSKRYVTLARKISTRTNTRIPAKFKIKFCKDCSNYLVPGINQRVRTKQGKIVRTCLICNKSKRKPFNRAS